MALISCLPNERGHARVLGLDARREAGGVRVALLLSDGGCPAQEAPALLWLDDDKTEELTVSLPALADGMYDDMVLTIVE